MHSSFIELRDWLSDQILGQPKLVDRLIIALLADGHLLVEGAPGLAKTKAIKSLSEGIEGSFQRIQFTPDLLPSDITGTEVYRPESGNLNFNQARFLIIWCWPMKSTVRQPKCRPRYLRQWPSGK